MEGKVQRTGGQPPEIINLDARIAQAGGTSSQVELLSHRLRATKLRPSISAAMHLEDLTRENGFLR